MTSPPLTLALLSVNVGLPAIIGKAHGAPVLSGIRKTKAAGTTILLTETNLAGDRQADLSVHGGPDKAVYAYPAGHWPVWRAEHGLAAGPGSFGENLTYEGATEEEIRIGDVFAWGDALLAVSQPRQPCFKLAMLLGRSDIGAAMVTSGRCGFYLRVLRGAEVPLHGASLARIQTRLEAPSVRTLFKTLYDTKATADRLDALAATPDLATDWRHAFATRAAARRKS